MIESPQGGLIIKEDEYMTIYWMRRAVIVAVAVTVLVVGAMLDVSFASKNGSAAEDAAND
jgi:hypothetical protein